MRVTKISVSNYRLLKSLNLDLEDELSLVIGKNNTGKTSLLSVLDKFINEKSGAKPFQCDDFNLLYQRQLKEDVETGSWSEGLSGISLRLFIEYNELDDLTNIGRIISDLDPRNNVVVLQYEYSISKDNFFLMISDFFRFKDEQFAKIDTMIDKLKNENPLDENKIERLALKRENTFYEFLKKEQSRYFKVIRRTIGYDASTNTEIPEQSKEITPDRLNLDRFICFRKISARRDVSNKETDKTLSYLSSEYYKKREALEGDKEAVKKFRDTLTETDIQLDGAYSDLFKNVVDKVKTFGGIRKGDSAIKIISTLQDRELLKGNTTVMYDHNEHYSLPEHYNGLGYMNLLGMIFEIEVILNDFRKEGKKDELPCDINLLFIEEPEAHTHPQMQYVFIKNIKSILRQSSMTEDGKSHIFRLQTIITTHSSHITAESKFDDIKYFKRETVMSVVARNLKDLEKSYLDDGESGARNYKFLRQYLTLHRAELFFADKAIFIEGDTERILLPAMMKKVDLELDEEDPPLLSQNISIVEVGAYSHIFERFINFIGVRSLIISDIDSVDSEGKKCRVDAGITTSNASLKHFYSPNDKVSYFTGLKFEEKPLARNNDTGKWQHDPQGCLLMIYQVSEVNNLDKDYCGRSFEDAFFHLNRKFIQDNKSTFGSLVWIKNFDSEMDAYDLAERCVDKKPSLAIEILLNSEMEKGKEYSNWETPLYIKEGLKWLKKDQI